MNICELNFKHNHYAGGKQARIHFENGYGASVITGSKTSYTTDELPYELAILKGEELCYDTGLTSDVFAYQTAKEIEAILDQIESLPSA